MSAGRSSPGRLSLGAAIRLGAWLSHELIDEELMGLPDDHNQHRLAVQLDFEYRSRR
jgi:hypothetical protein